ncbi:MAG: winged helix-turn-helix transcriptional regulator [Methanobacteriota archaeon]|nr:MAG: winged helix-turn-helix transcriptional regulator [Euryarchaeota archaeon]
MRDPLDLANRKRIFEFIRSSPGVHFREIQRRTRLPIGVLEYNLNYLVRKELLSVERHDNFSRYYPSGQLSKEKQKILSVLRQEIPRGIVLYLLRNPGATHTELLDNFTISGGTLSYHVKKLTIRGVVSAEKRGRESYLRVTDPDKVADLLIVYRRTFFDKLVDEFVARYIEHK